MIAMEDWVTIKTIKAKNPKLSHRAIARLIGISHHTVKTALGWEAPPGYQRKSPATPSLRPFGKSFSRWPMSSASVVPASLKSCVRRATQAARPRCISLLAELKVETQRTFMPYETQPGEQAQFDWSPYTVLIAGQLTRMFVYSYINGFSRFRVYDVALSENQGAVFEAYENGLIESGGVPQRVQTDNAKVFVHNASRSNFHWNPRYLHFCGYYGFEPSRSFPGHPWSKGKVEKPFDFLETHFIAGAAFENFPDLLVKLKAFQVRVNTRPHATIKMTPEDAHRQRPRGIFTTPRDPLRRCQGRDAQGHR